MKIYKSPKYHWVEASNVFYPVESEGSKAAESGSFMSVEEAIRIGGDLAVIGKAAKHLGMRQVAYAWTGVLNAMGHTGNNRPAWKPREKLPESAILLCEI